MLHEIREWVMLGFEAYICWILTLEYFYDANKDAAKKQRSTRTMKKTTTNKDGSNTVEESVEAIEPVGEASNKAYDLWASRNSKKRLTASKTITMTAQKHLIIPFLWGFITGHLFWSQRHLEG